MPVQTFADVAVAVVGRHTARALRGGGTQVTDAVDLHAVLAVGVGHQSILAAGAVRAQGLRGAREQVDCWRAAQAQFAGLQVRPAQRGAVEGDQHLAVTSSIDRWQQRQIEEGELVGEGEVLCQQAQAGVLAIFVRQQRLLVAEAHRD